MIKIAGSEGSSRCAVPTRYALAVVGFLGYAFLSAMRLDLSLTIMATVNVTAVYAIHREGFDITWQADPYVKEGEFAWSPKMQGIVLGAFYWMLGLGSAIGGRMCDTLGSKNVCGIGMLILSLLTIATPIVARSHWYALVAIRAIAGLCEGCVFPSFFPLVRRWIPPSERSSVLSVVIGGVSFGSFVTIAASGFLCDSEFLGGWPSFFYVCGILGCLWCFLFKFLIYEKPSDHPWITDKELEYILENNQISNTKAASVPWKSMLICPKVWALIMGGVAVRWAELFLYTVHPTYMATILKYPITKNGVLLGIPHLLTSVMGFFAGSISDFIKRRKYMSITLNHKCIVTTGHV